MRRRIYLDQYSGPQDVTTQWSLWGDEEDAPLPVLEDDALWAEYETAQLVLESIVSRIHDALRDMPWTRSERRLIELGHAVLEGTVARFMVDGAEDVVEKEAHDRGNQ